MNTNQPPYGPGFRNAHLAEQTRLLTEISRDTHARAEHHRARAAYYSKAYPDADAGSDDSNTGLRHFHEEEVEWLKRIAKALGK